MKDYRKFILNKRNGNGQSTCDICKIRTWDCMCYNLEVYCYETKISHLVICDECKEHINGFENND